MREFASDIAFTLAVKGIQADKDSRSSYARMEMGSSWETTVTPELQGFLADLDMFYLGTANAEGQPYIQYRGGSSGFLKVVDESRLGFADFGGNRQYITLGNISENPRAFIFLMDYAHSRRIKLIVIGPIRCLRPSWPQPTMVPLRNCTRLSHCPLMIARLIN